MSPTFYCVCPPIPSGDEKLNGNEGNVFLNERLNSSSAKAQFLGVSTARIVVASLQGHGMKRKVNECGERAGSL